MSTIVCEICGEVSEKNKYERHIKFGHKAKRENKCQLCQKEFTSFYNLQYHLAHHKNAREFLCSECPRAYNTVADLTQHQRVHEKQRDPFRCEMCGLIFQIRSKFKTHMRTHQSLTLKGPRECPICKKFFVCLSSHNRTVHLKLRTYECNQCDKTFGKKSGLDRHTLTVHDKIRAFKCDFVGCLRAFGEKSQLTKHMRIHEEKEASYCSFCKINVGDIKIHFEEEHQDFTERCKICFKRFSKLRSLELHIKVFHTIEQNYFCDFCPNKGFAKRFQLKRHLRSHKELNKNNCDDINLNVTSNVRLEQIFFDDLPESTEGTDELSPPGVAVDVLVDIKTEIMSDDETQRKNELANICDQQNRINQEDDAAISNKEEEEKSNSRFTDKKSDKEFYEHHDLTTQSALPQHCEAAHEISNSAKRTCHICDKTFSKERNLKVHNVAVHSEKYFECEICLKKFSFKSAKERHVKVVHFNQRSHHCQKCQKLFGTKVDLTNHIAYHHSSEDIRKYFCPICEKSFTSSSALTRHHKGVHENIKQKRTRDYRCKFCKEVMKNKYQKEKHLALVHHDGLKPKRTCQLCDAHFELFDEFRKHIDQHVNAFICVICGKDNPDQIEKDVHMESHKHINLDLRRFSCDFCGHKLFNKIQLKVHMRKHMKETNFYVCEICGQSYKFIAPFLYHKKLHKGVKEFVCTHCGKEFMRKQDLTIHTRSHTQEKPFKCTVCEKCFAARQILQIHLQTHSSTRKVYNCQDCQLTFSDKNQARIHDEDYHPERRPIWCHLCRKSFKLVHLLRIHMKHIHKPDETIELPAANDFIFNNWNL